MSSRYGEVPDNHFLINIYIFRNLRVIQFNEDDLNHHDHHDESQDDGGYPPSLGMFLTTLFHLTSQVLHILDFEAGT